VATKCCVIGREGMSEWVDGYVIELLGEW
jgi:hypothetical protein